MGAGLDAEFRSSLTVTVVSATLAPLPRGAFDSSADPDTFATVVWGRQRFSTKVAREHGTLPVWNETYTFEVDEDDTRDLIVQIYCREPKDLLLAVASLPLSGTYDVTEETSLLPLYRPGEVYECGQLKLTLKWEYLTSASLSVGTHGAIQRSHVTAYPPSSTQTSDFVHSQIRSERLPLSKPVLDLTKLSIGNPRHFACDTTGAVFCSSPSYPPESTRQHFPYLSMDYPPSGNNPHSDPYPVRLPENLDVTDPGKEKGSGSSYAPQGYPPSSHSEGYPPGGSYPPQHYPGAAASQPQSYPPAHASYSQYPAEERKGDQAYPGAYPGGHAPQPESGYPPSAGYPPGSGQHNAGAAPVAYPYQQTDEHSSGEYGKAAGEAGHAGGEGGTNEKGFKLSQLEQLAQFIPQQYKPSVLQGFGQQGHGGHGQQAYGQQGSHGQQAYGQQGGHGQQAYGQHGGYPPAPPAHGYPPAGYGYPPAPTAHGYPPAGYPSQAGHGTPYAGHGTGYGSSQGYNVSSHSGQGEYKSHKGGHKGHKGDKMKKMKKTKGYGGYGGGHQKHKH